MSAPTETKGPRQDADTVSAARGMAAQRRGGGPPWAGAGQPVEKATDFGPVRAAARGPAAARALGRGRRTRARRRLGGAQRDRPEDPRPRHRRDLRGDHRQAASPGITADQAAAAARAAGNATVAGVIEGQHVVPGVGIDFSALGLVLLTVVGIYVGAALFGYAQGYLLNGIVQRTIYTLRRDVEDKLNRLPLSYFDGRQRGEVLSRVTNDIDNVSTSLQQTMSQLITSILTVIGVLLMMFVVSPLLSLIALVTIPVSLWLTRAIGKRSQKHFVAQWKHTGALNGQIEESFTGHDAGARVRPAARGGGRASGPRTRSSSSASFGAQFVSGIIMPVDDVHREPQLRRDRRRRRAAGGVGRDAASATCRRSSSTRASSPSR